MAVHIEIQYARLDELNLDPLNASLDDVYRERLRFRW